MFAQAGLQAHTSFKKVRRRNPVADGAVGFKKCRQIVADLYKLTVLGVKCITVAGRKSLKAFNRPHHAVFTHTFLKF